MSNRFECALFSRGIPACALLLLLTPAVTAQLALVMTSDSIVDPGALLMPTSNAGFGRAINGAAFQASALVSHNGYQYTAWYRKDAATDESVMLARRSINGAAVGAWETYDTGWNFVNGDDGTWDAHNTISIGISKNDGRLHIAWDHHLHNLRYAVSAAGLTDGTVPWGPGMLGSERSDLSGTTLFGITYPMFIPTSSGDLQFAYRSGSSIDGTFRLATFAGGAWSAPRAIIGPTGSYAISSSVTSTSRNGYPNGFTYALDGTLHTTFVWRENGAYGNHDLNYASSADGGVTWRNNSGIQIADTAANDMILIGDDGLVVQSLDVRQSLYNQQSQAVDPAGGMHTVVVHRRQEAGYEYRASHPQWDPERSAYHHYYRDPASGDWSMHRLPVETGVGARPAVGVDADGNVFAVYTDRGPEDGSFKYNPGNLVIAGATAAAGYSDWSVLHIESIPLQFIGEPLLDTGRLRADGILSIFIQENSSAAGAVGTNLHVIEFAVPEPGAGGVLGAAAMALLAGRRRHRIAPAPRVSAIAMP